MLQYVIPTSTPSSEEKPFTAASGLVIRSDLTLLTWAKGDKEHIVEQQLSVQQCRELALMLLSAAMDYEEAQQRH